MSNRPTPSLISHRVTWLSVCLLVASTSAVVLTVRPQLISHLESDQVLSFDFDTLLLTATTAPQASTDGLRLAADEVQASLIEAYPKAATAFHIAATYSARVRQYDDAIDLWAKAVSLDPQFLAARTAAADALLQQGDPDAARHMLLQVTNGDQARDTVYGCTLLVQSWEMSGDLPRAIQECEDALRTFPNNPLLLLERARLSLELNDIETAAACLQNVINSVPNVAEAYRLMAVVEARRGNALEHQRLHETYDLLRSNKPASEERFQIVYRHALEETVYDLFVLAAEEHSHHGRLLHARHLLQQAVVLDHTDVEAYRSLVKNFLLSNQPEQAYAVQKHICDHHPSASALRNLAAIAIQQGDADDAMHWLKRALLFDPHSETTLKSLVLVSRQARDAPQMNHYAEALVAAVPSPENYRTLAEARRFSRERAGNHVAPAHLFDHTRAATATPTER